MKPDEPVESRLSDRPTVIFAGAFGSGKTEVAVSYARAARAAGNSTCIIDMDVVTPYFRVGDHREQLQREGLRVIASEGGLARFELPAVPREIAEALSDAALHIVLDVGGDAVGTRLLGVYAEKLKTRGYDFWVVANPFRPTAATPAALAEHARAIAAQCDLQLSGVVANPNLGSATRPEHIRLGYGRVVDGARLLGLPLVFVAVEQRLARAEELPRVPVLPLDLILRLPWQPGSSGRETRG